MNNPKSPADLDSNKEVFKQAVKDLPRMLWFYLLLFMVIYRCIQSQYGVWGWIGMIFACLAVLVYLRMSSIRRERYEASELEGEEGFAPDDDDTNR